MKVYERVRTLPSGFKQRKWIADLGVVKGKRVMKYFPTKGKAEACVKEAREKKENEGRSAFAMSVEERVEFERSRRQLADVGATVDDAVRFYLASHTGLRERVTLAELLDRAMLAKELADLRSRYVTQFGVSCRSFISGRHDQLAHETTRADVQAWLSAHPEWAHGTQKVYLGDVRSMFSWGVEQGLVRINPAAGKFPLKPKIDAEIEALSAEQARRLIAAAMVLPPGGRVTYTTPPLLWYVVLGLYAGVRPEELARLERAKVSLEEAHVTIDAKIAKTRQRRVIDLSENAIELLALDTQRSGPVRPVNWKLLWGRLREEAGFRAPAWTHRRGGEEQERAAGSAGEEWPHDAARHTFASMHYALHQDEALLKAQMGHSKAEDTLMQHYRAMQTRREAEKFWSLTPGEISAAAD